MVIDAKGKDKRGNGTAGAHVTATMTETGSSTRVEVLTDLNITGKPAQFGRGVMQDVSDKLLGQFTACLEKKVGDASAAGVAAAAAAEPAGPSGGEAEPEVGGGADVRAAGAATTTGPRLVEPSSGAAGSTTDDTRRLPPHDVSPSGNDEALDLGATVLPVLAKAYWKQAVGLVLALLVLRRLLRR
jgi:hypothetical protein